MSQKPSKKFIMTGYLEPSERYHPDIHRMIDVDNLTVAQAANMRNRDYENNGTYYSQEEINKWIGEMKPAECPICLEQITKQDIKNNNCLSCVRGHKFHSSHNGIRDNLRSCPICRSTEPFHQCNNEYDTAVGGKKRRQTNKKRRQTRKKRRQTRKKRQIKKGGSDQEIMPNIVEEHPIIRPKVNVKGDNDLFRKYVSRYINSRGKLPNHLKYHRIGLWDVSEITDMRELFAHTNFNEDISEWDVSNVKNMQAMFYGCTQFNSPLNKWNVSNVTNMSSMFGGCLLFNQPLDRWDVSNVTEMVDMFQWCASFNQPLNNWDISNVVHIQGIFGYTTEKDSNMCHINRNYVSNWEPKKVGNLYGPGNFKLSCSYIIRDIIRDYNNLSQEQKDNLKIENENRRLFNKETINAFETINQNINSVTNNNYRQKLSEFIDPENYNIRELSTYIR